MILKYEMKRALEDYFKELKSRRSSKAKRKSVLFPDYDNENILRRHWKKFGTSHSQIKRDGELYKKEEEQRRYEERIRIRRDSDSENDHVDMICDIDDDD